MNHSNLPKTLTGIVPPIVTPLKSRDVVDVEGFEKLIEHMIAGGIHGLFVLGSTGEAPSLSYKTREEVIERACRQVNGRIPVIVGITDTSFAESVKIASVSEKAGADAVVIAPPYYFPAGQPELLEYLQHITPELGLPLFLYNMPGLTKLTFEPDTVRKASEIKGIVGLKDSSANMIYFHKLQALFVDRPEFSLLVGAEELLAETVLLGGHGCICGGANLFPKLYVDLFNAARAGDLKTSIALHDKVMQVSSAIYGVGHHWSSYLKGVKGALSCMGICDDFMAEPFHRFRKEEKSLLGERLAKLNLN